MEHVSALNAIGIPGWWLNSVLLRRRAVPGIQARINDWLVPLLRLEERLGLGVGMSMVAVGRKRAELVGGRPDRDPSLGVRRAQSSETSSN